MSVKDCPIVSVIVPIYNAEHYLHQCLDSIAGQSYNKLEIILVDDGSRDASPAICDEYALKDSRFKVLHKKNEGVSLARNSGLKLVTGDYVMFVDSDDWLDENAIECCVSKALEFCADVVHVSYRKVFANRSVPVHVFPESFVCNEPRHMEAICRRLYGPLDEELASPATVDAMVLVWMQLFKVDMLRGVRFYDIRKIGSAEDCLYMMDVLQRCKAFAYIDQPLYNYRKGNNASLTSRYRENLLELRNHLYDMMEQKIERYQLPSAYRKALNNRIAICMTGMGFNEIASGKFWKSTKRLKDILESKRYADALAQLDFSYFPLHWKLFYWLCKKRRTISLLLLLHLMNWLRRYVLK